MFDLHRLYTLIVHRFAVLMCLVMMFIAAALMSTPAHAATASRSGSAALVSPHYRSVYTVTVGNAALVVPLGLNECGIDCVVVVTPSSATSTLTSISDGRIKGQTMTLLVTGTNTLVVGTALTNVDFGTAGDATIYEGHGLTLVWDGTDWRAVGVVGLTSTVAELNILDGVTATGTELNQYVVTLDIVDLDTDATYYVVLPHAGTIDTISSVIHSAIATADATITCNIGATPITGGAITVTQSGSAAGDVDTVSPSAAKTVTAGQAVNCAVTGSNTGAARTTLSFTVTR